ncbi:hypothetical protein [Actinomadura montaniterrae]|uniref:Toxin-antitoxin system HicB family antitoxin n=1 Tax=Actinomadura montaniterrae TaxID=1803903 RepID=A0A6L3VTN1_9ACTN|nr:hypothetical protein [Actinomadura montaniterrae]KAB2375407.1 hypothetical protein F9B16_26165 [Actinomadura montaniterrae]
MATERKKILLRLDPAVHDALARWAGDELRSTNAQIEFLLRQALADAGRMPGSAGRMRRPGRPRKAPDGRSAPEDGASNGQGAPGERGSRPGANEE